MNGAVNSGVVQAPALGISVSCDAGACQIVFQTHVPQDTDKATLDALVDRVAAVAARQKAKAELVELRKNLKVNEDQLRRMREDRENVETRLTAAVQQEGRRGPTKVADEQKVQQQREQANANDKRFVEIIADGKQQIAEAEALIGK